MADKKKTAPVKARSEKPASAARGSLKAPPAKSVKARPVKSPAKPAAAAQGAKQAAAKPATAGVAKPKVAAKAVTVKSASAKPAAPKVIGTKPNETKAAAGATPKKAPVKAPAPLPVDKKVVPLPQAASAGEAKKAATAPVAGAAKPSGAKGVVKPLGAPAAAKPGQQAATGQFRAVAAAMAKSHAQRVSAPVPAKAAASKPATAEANKKPINQRHGFKTNEYVVYPAHGVGRIVGIEEQEIAGMSLELFVITFDKDKMTLRVPTGKLASVGMRKLADEGIVHKAMETLKGRARIKRTMWSRRAQEYEAKINSGNLIQIAEVVRDLYRSEAQPEQSYSERQLYEAALDRMSREIAAVDRTDERGAMQRITEILSKSAKGRRAAEVNDGETGEDDADVRAA